MSSNNYLSETFIKKLDAVLHMGEDLCADNSEFFRFNSCSDCPLEFKGSCLLSDLHDVRKKFDSHRC